MPSALRRPTTRTALLESRAVLELGAFAALTPALQLTPRGDGHPVLVLPGLGATDESTRPLRWFLGTRGYEAHGWELGRSVGPSGRVRKGLETRLRALADQRGQTVSIVGWSLGGIYARELTRRNPTLVRGVVTLGSPFRSLDRLSRSDVPLQDSPLDGDHSGQIRRDIGRDDGGTAGVPSTAVFTRTDGVVPWQACVERPGPRRESIEVVGSHIGLGHNPAVVVVVADRLAQPEGRWAPFRPPRGLSRLFPDPSAP
jgi:pimeloyl-ACP methyl ester carboxylesterase